MDILINGNNIELYKAKMFTPEIGACDFTDTYFLPPKAMNPRKITSTASLRPIVLKMNFEGDDVADATRNMSDVTALLHQGAELLLPDGFYYTVVLDKVGKAVQVAPWILQTTYTLSGFRHGPLVSKSLTATGSILVLGNYNTEVKVEITTTGSSVTIFGITVSNITGKVIIDGLKKTITQNGINKFIDSNLTEFPKLVPGNNTITITGTGTFKISYYPIYL